MKTKIKDIYQRLTNRELVNDDSVISPEVFSSVLLDRFNAELIKMGISWDKSATSITALTSGNTHAATSQSSSVETNRRSVNSGGKFGVGTDIQKIDKFSTVKDPWEDAFYKDQFKDIEIAYCLKKENPFQSFAGIFSAKEAVFKATGVDRNQITITFDEQGKPLCDYASVSISHDGDYATAIAAYAPKEIKEQPDIVSIHGTSEERDSTPKKGTNVSNIIAFVSLLIVVFYIFYKEWLVQLN